jgi:hypothetical protein
MTKKKTRDLADFLVGNESEIPDIAKKKKIAKERSKKPSATTRRGPIDPTSPRGIYASAARAATALQDARERFNLANDALADARERLTAAQNAHREAHAGVLKLLDGTEQTVRDPKADITSEDASSPPTEGDR